MRKAMRDSIKRYTDARARVITRKISRRVVDEAAESMVAQSEKVLEKAKAGLESEAASEKDPVRKSTLRKAISILGTVFAALHPIGQGAMMMHGAAKVIGALTKILFNLTKLLPLLGSAASAQTITAVKIAVGLIKKAIGLARR